MSPLVALNPRPPLVMSTASNLLAPVVAGPGMFEVLKLDNKNIFTDFTLYRSKMHLSNVPFQKQSILEPWGNTVRVADFSLIIFP